MAFEEATINISLVPDGATTVFTFAGLDSSGNAVTDPTDETDILVGVFAETVPLDGDSNAVVAPITILGVAMVKVGAGGVTAGLMASNAAGPNTTTRTRPTAPRVR